jgi:hypothetical protein
VNHVQAPQQQRHAAHQDKKTHTSHEFPHPDLSRTIKLSPNDRGSIVYFAGTARKCSGSRRSVEHGRAHHPRAARRGRLPTRAPSGRGRSLADDSESAKSPSISLGTRWARSLVLPHQYHPTEPRRSPGISFVYRARLKAYQPSVVSPEM